jgi:hypothetical protein
MELAGVISTPDAYHRIVLNGVAESYSVRKASIGSTCVAFLAGSQQASSATERRTNETTRKTMGSVAFTL